MEAQKFLEEVKCDGILVVDLQERFIKELFPWVESYYSEFLVKILNLLKNAKKNEKIKIYTVGTLTYGDLISPVRDIIGEESPEFQKTQYGFCGRDEYWMDIAKEKLKDLENVVVVGLYLERCVRAVARDVYLRIEGESYVAPNFCLSESDNPKEWSTQLVDPYEIIDWHGKKYYGHPSDYLTSKPKMEKLKKEQMEKEI